MRRRLRRRLVGPCGIGNLVVWMLVTLTDLPWPIQTLFPPPKSIAVCFVCKPYGFWNFEYFHVPLLCSSFQSLFVGSWCFFMFFSLTVCSQTTALYLEGPPVTFTLDRLLNHQPFFDYTTLTLDLFSSLFVCLSWHNNCTPINHSKTTGNL